MQRKWLILRLDMRCFQEIFSVVTFWRESNSCDYLFKSSKSLFSCKIQSVLNTSLPRLEFLNIHEFSSTFYWISFKHALEKKITRFLKFAKFLLKHFHSNPMLSFYNERGINNDVSWIKSEVFALPNSHEFYERWKYVTRLYKRRIKFNWIHKPVILNSTSGNNNFEAVKGSEIWSCEI